MAIERLCPVSARADVADQSRDGFSRKLEYAVSALDFHLVKLAEERLFYALRLMALTGKNGHDIEAAGYSSKIDKLNKASIELARDYELDGERGRFSKCAQ